jgi:MFS family permease
MIRNRISSYWKINQSMMSMIVLVILIGMGEKLGERFLPLYLLSLGGGTLAIGLLNGITNFLGAIYSLPGGYLSDRLGYKRALILFTSIALLGYFIVIVVQSWWAVLAGAVFFIAWSAITLPAVMSLIAERMPQKKQTFGVSIHSFIRRIPMALGPLVGGALLTALGTVAGIRAAFILAFILGLLALWFVNHYMSDTSSKTEIRSPRRFFSNLRGPLSQLLISDILIRFCEQIPYAFVVVWCVKFNGISTTQFGVLTAIEMITAMLIYLPVARFADKGAKKPFVVITFIFFTLFPLTLMLAKTFWALVPVFIIRGLKEFGEPTRKTLILQLSPQNEKAGTFGAYYLVRDIIVTFAALSGAWLWSFSPQLNLVSAFGFGLIGTLFFVLRGKNVEIQK